MADDAPLVEAVRARSDEARLADAVVAPAPVPFDAYPDHLASPVAPVVWDPSARRWLRWETVFVLTAFLMPAVATAIVIFAKHAATSGSYHLFPTYVAGNPVLNLVLGIVAYVPVAALVPLVVLLLARTGQPPRALGLGRPFEAADVGLGIGLAAGAFFTEILLAVVISPLLQSKHAVNVLSIGKVPAYYVIWGLAISLVTAVTEEVIVNGYLLTRLGQLGWTTWPALWLSLALRTSYHVYYGLGFLLTIPFGYYVTRSFQKHGRLNRAIVAHFVFDAVTVTIAIYAHR
jgi:hypothetical protein